MKKLTIITFAVATLLATAGAASAQYIYLGPGYGPQIGPVYDDDRRYYRDRDYYEDRRYRREGYRTWNGCPPRYTIQDGVCKPYRGF